MKAFSREQLDSIVAVAQKHDPLDALMILVMFNHGLRVSECLSLSAKSIVGDLLIVPRLKGSNDAHHPIQESEREELLALVAKIPDGRFFPICRKTAWARIKKYGAEAGIPEFLCHPHSLRHTTGKLGLKGGMTIPQIQSYLGHKNGANTLVYLQCDEEEASMAFAAAVGGK